MNDLSLHSILKLNKLFVCCLFILYQNVTTCSFSVTIFFSGLSHLNLFPVLQSQHLCLSLIQSNSDRWNEVLGLHVFLIKYSFSIRNDSYHSIILGFKHHFKLTSIFMSHVKWYHSKVALWLYLNSTKFGDSQLWHSKTQRNRVYTHTGTHTLAHTHSDCYGLIWHLSIKTVKTAVSQGVTNLHKSESHKSCQQLNMTTLQKLNKVFKKYFYIILVFLFCIHSYLLQETINPGFISGITPLLNKCEMILNLGLKARLRTKINQG